MPLVTLKKEILTTEGIGHQEKQLLVRIDVKTAIRLKEVAGIDVYSPLDDEGSKNVYTALVTDRKAAVEFAMAMFPEIEDLDDWLDGENIDAMRKAIIDAIVNFSQPHSRSQLLSHARQMEQLAMEMGEKTAASMLVAMDALREDALETIPGGEEMVKSIRQSLRDLIPSVPGSEHTTRSERSATRKKRRA